MEFPEFFLAGSYGIPSGLHHVDTSDLHWDYHGLGRGVWGAQTNPGVIQKAEFKVGNKTISTTVGMVEMLGSDEGLPKIHYLNAAFEFSTAEEALEVAHGNTDSYRFFCGSQYYTSHVVVVGNRAATISALVNHTKIDENFEVLTQQVENGLGVKPVC